MDPYKKLRVSLNSDGTLTRYADIPIAPPTSEDPSPDSAAALSKDVPLNATNNTWLRIFLPKLDPPAKSNLPVILYFHGGGFILYSAATVFFHNSCANLAAQLPAIVLSVEYRLAPEHRLPAAYDDAVDALLWVRDQARGWPNPDPWLKAHADFSQCFLMGSSSGGNIVYNLGIRSLELELEPVKIRGLILNQPFFGGEERTESEERMVNDNIVPQAVADLMWELALPQGENRDHEYSNPMVTAKTAKGRGLPRCLVRGYVGDPLIDRQRAFAAMLEKEGVSVVARLEEEGFHGIEIFDSEKAEALVADVRDFVCGGTGARSVHRLWLCMFDDPLWVRF